MTARIVWLVPVLFLFSGCFVPHLIAGVQDTGLTVNSRRSLLPKEVKEFQEAVYYNNVMKALTKVADEMKESVKGDLMSRKERERIVEYKVEFSDFDESAYRAKVDVAVKYFEIPRYVVQTRIEKEDWHYITPGGWKLVDRKFEQKP